MYRELKNPSDYWRKLVLFSILTVVFGVAFCCIGELFLPFAGAFCACLFLFEEPKKRILSYIIPILPIAVGFIKNGLYGIIGIEFVVIAILISFMYSRRFSKSEVAAYTVALVVLFFVVSLYLGATKATGSFSPAEITAYYKNMILTTKADFIELLINYKATGADGEAIYPFDYDIAAATFESIISFFVSIVVIIAFILTGITLKLYSFSVRNVCRHGILRSFAMFVPSNATAYFYVIVSILGAFMGGVNIFEISVLNVVNIFTAVFAYMGIKFALDFAKINERRSLIYTILIVALISMTSLAFQLLSYLGAYVVISFNNKVKFLNDN